MLKNITILISVLLCTEKVFSQNEFSQQLLMLEEKAFLCTNDTLRNDFYLQKFDLYIQQDKLTEGVLDEAKRIDYRLFKEKMQQLRFLWNASLVGQLSQKEKLAAYYYSRYQELNPDTSIAATLLGALIYMPIDSAVSSNYANRLSYYDKRFACLDCIQKVMVYERENRNLYLVSSAIIPGLGSALNGNVLKGTTSLLINSLAVYAVYVLIQSNLYFNAFFWGGAFLTKFYIGNIKLTGSLFDQKEERKKNKLATNCELMLSGVLKEHPIFYR